MKIYPAIDLQQGRCVRLFQGDFSQSVIYEQDPLAVATAYQQAGAEFLHVVDLDGAREGSSQNHTIIHEIVTHTDLPVQIGGGLRSTPQVKKLLDMGAARVVIGSTAVKSPELVRSWLDQFGPDKIVLAFDIRINLDNVPCVATQGWLETTDVSLWHLLQAYQMHGLVHVLCTDIACDGTLAGPNLELYAEFKERFPFMAVQASGGVASLEDLQACRRIPVEGVIVGKALYEKCFTLAEALAC